MNRSKRISSSEIYKVILCIFPIVLFIGMFVIGSEKMSINSILPEQVYTTKEQIALSVYGKGFKEQDVIYIDGKEQETTYGNEGWLTCFISDEIKSLPQSVEVEVRRDGKIVDKSSNGKILRVIQ